MYESLELRCKTMYYFSKNVIIEENIIRKRRVDESYEISSDLFEIMYSWALGDKINLEDINVDTAKFLIDEDIITNVENMYNPICFPKDRVSTKRIFVQLTDRCNLKCKHCYAEGSPNNCSNIDLKCLISFLENAIKKGVNQIDFTGGEIFLYKNLFGLLDFLENRPVTTNLFTNLVLCNESCIEKLTKYNCIRKIITSLDYFSPQLHNEFRQGEFAYERTMNAINILKKHQINVSINTIVLDDNHEEIEKLSQFFEERGIEVVIDNLIWEGRATHFANSKNFKKNARFLAGILQKKFGNSCLETLDEKFESGNCGIGENLMYISSNGEIALCPSLVGVFPIGNIDSMKFSDANKSKNEAARVLTKLTDCENSDCLVMKSCKGGCRARAYHMTKKMDSIDEISCYRYGRL